jgi:hypothetical protein
MSSKKMNNVIVCGNLEELKKLSLHQSYDYPVGCVRRNKKFKFNSESKKKQKV